MATIHLLHGLPGTGKTTFARKLAFETGAVVLNHDKWMTTLFGNNPPAERIADYQKRIDILIWTTTGEFVRHGVDIILDHGFWTRASRDEARSKASDWGAAVKLYHMVCPDSVADARVLIRNKSLNPGVLSINEYALNIFRRRYEPLADDEPSIPIDTSG